MTTNDNKKQGIIPIIIILFVVVIGIVYFFGMKKNNSGSTTSLVTPIVTQSAEQIGNYDNNMNDQNNINNLVKNFYSAIESQDGKLLFSYFTPPSTAEEKTSFTWLTGADLAGTPIYRAFFRQKISNPKIDSTQGINNVFTVKVSDQLTGIPSAGSETTVYTPQPRNVVLTIIKSGDKWLIDKYTDPSAKTGTEKYSGFAQGY